MLFPGGGIMLTGMVGVRTPSDIKKAREATEAYLKKLQEANPSLDLFRNPPTAGRPTGAASEVIPHYFAWNLLPSRSKIIGQPSTNPPSSQPPPQSSSFQAPQSPLAPSPETPRNPQMIVYGNEGKPKEEEVPLSIPASSPRRLWSPYRPLFTRRKLHQHLAPKVTDKDALRNNENQEEELRELDTSGVVDVLPPPSVRTEYMDAFKWHDVASVRSSIDAIRASHASTTNIFGGDQDVAMSTETLPVATQPSKDDQLWDVLQPLCSNLSTPAPPPERPHGRALLSEPKAKDDKLWDLLQSFEAPHMPEGGEGGVGSSVKAPLPPVPPLILGGKKHARSQTDHCWGLLGGQGPIPAKFTVPMSSRSSVSSTSLQTSPAAQKGSPTRRSFSRRGKKKIKRPPSTTSSSSSLPLNPILMYPRYPPERQSQSWKKSEYAAKYSWNTKPAHVGI